MSLKNIPVWVGGKGQAPPAGSAYKRGQVNIEHPSSGRDIPYLCIRDASDAHVLAELALAADVGLALSGKQDDLSPWESNIALAGRNVVMQVQADGNATTWSSIGCGAPVPTSPTAAVNADTNSSGSRIAVQTAGSNGSVASLVGGAGMNAIRSGWQPVFEARIEVGTISNVRWWIGLFSSTPAGSSDPTISGMGFRYDAGQSDTEWKCWSNDNSGGGLLTASGVSLSSNTTYRLSIVSQISGGRVLFFINDTLVATHTTNLPVTTTYLAAGLYVTALSSNARLLRINRMSVAY